MKIQQMKLVNITLSLFLFFLLAPLSMLHSQQLDHVPGEILVHTDQIKDIDRIIDKYANLRGQPTDLQKARLLKTGIAIHILRFNHLQIHERELLAQMRRDPMVLDAQFNHLLTNRQTVPNDPSFNQQWFWINKDAVTGAIDADLAWDESTGGMTPDGKEIVVAIVDNGIDLNHDDFQGNLWVNNNEVANNGVDDDNNGYIDDVRGWNINSDDDNVQIGLSSDGHGVEVAGMVGARGNNSIGITGVNWNIKVMMIKNADGASQAVALEAYAYIHAMRQLYNESNGQKGAFIVAANSSWGLNFATASDAPIWCNFYNTLGEVGVISCAATTNLSTDVDLNGDLPTTCPSNYLIAVTRTGNQKEQAGGFGPINIDLGAPGINVFTTQMNNAYGIATGTSLSSPLVAGMVAFLYSIPGNVLSEIAETDPASAARLSRDYILDGVLEANGFEDLVASKGIANLAQSTNLVKQDEMTCFTPFGFQVTDRTDLQMTLDWSTVEVVDQINLRWRNSSSSDWTKVENATKPFTLDNLMSCTDYDFQLSSVCNGVETPYSATTVFTTDGCCSPPEEINITDITDNSVNISWESIFAAINYLFEFRETGTSNWTMITSNGTTQSLTDLSPCTPYEVRIRTICTGLNSSYSLIKAFNTIGCGKCEDAPYCEVEGDTENEFIDKVVINGVTNSTGDNGGYASFFDLPLDFEPGQTYDIELTPGYPGFAYTEDFYVWIDYNHDGDFEDDNEAVLFLENTNTAIDGTFTIPPTAFSGNTRMRITIFFFGSTEPCTSPKEGETEDYCITIGGDNVECFPPKNLAANPLDEFSAQITWSAAVGANNYQLSWKESVGTEWDEITTDATSYLLTGLKTCTNYDYKISSECNEATSDFSDPLGFKTMCKTGIKDLEETIKLSVYPNPFEDQLYITYEEESGADWSVDLIEVNGRIVSTFSPLSGNTPLSYSTRSLASGIYFLRVRNKEGQVIRKLLKL